MNSGLGKVFGWGVVFSLLGFVQSVLLARHLGVNGRGVVAIPISFINLMLPIAVMGLKQGMTYYYFDKALFLSRMSLYLTLLISSSLVMVFIIGFYFSFPEYNEDIYVIGALFLAKALIDIYSYTYYFDKSVYKIAKINVIRLIIEIILIVVVASFSELDPTKVFLIYLVSALFQLACVKLDEKKNTFIGSYKITSEFILKSLSFAVPLFFINVNLTIDIVLLGRLAEPSEVGFYQVAVSIANLTWVLPAIISPYIFSKSATKSLDEILINAKKTLLLVTILIPLVIPIWYISPYIFTILFGSDFSKSSSLFNIILPGYITMLFYKFVNGMLSSKGFTKMPLVIFALGAILNILLNIITIPSYGSKGAAYSTLASYLFCSILFFVYVGHMSYAKNKKMVT